MGRTRELSFVLWSALAGCGSTETSHLADAPPADAAAPHLSLDSTALALSATCGDALPATVDVTITNGGAAALVISAATADGGFTVTTALPLSIAAGAHATLSVRPPAAVIGTDLAGATKTGTLTLATNDPGSPSATVALTATVQGANLAFTDDVGAPVSLDFAFTGTSGACPAPRAVFIHNSGTLPATIATSAGSHFALGGFASGDVSGGGVAQQSVRPVTQLACAASESVTYQITGPVCTDAQVSIGATFNLGGASTCFCS